MSMLKVKLYVLITIIRSEMPLCIYLCNTYVQVMHVTRDGLWLTIYVVSSRRFQKNVQFPCALSILESVLSEEHNLIPSFNLSQIRVKKAKARGEVRKGERRAKDE